MTTIKNYIRKLVLGKKASSESYIKYLRKRGAFVGDRTTFFSPLQISIDDTQPWMIEIGDDVQITAGVRILTHDYSWAVLKKVYGSIVGMAGSVKIGNNVFIGSDTTILGGTKIGDNVIIGAGSLVKGCIPSNCVAAGNPCRKIMSLEEYYQKRQLHQEIEAFELAESYYRHTGKVPEDTLFHEFFFLFSNKPYNTVFDDKLKLVGNYDMSIEALNSHSPQYKNFSEFIKAAGIIKSNK